MKTSQILTALAAIQISISASASDFERVHERITSLIGSEVEVALASTRIDGIVQVTAGTDVFFMTDDGQFFIQGKLGNL